jgi:predicted flap endonuclease-1-like 5' DNA nuclease
MTCYDFLKPYVLWASKDQLTDPYRYVLGTRISCMHPQGASDTIDGKIDINEARFSSDGVRFNVRLRGSGTLVSTQPPGASSEASQTRKVMIQIDASHEGIHIRVGDVVAREIIIDFNAECKGEFLMGVEGSKAYTVGLQKLERTDSGWIPAPEDTEPVPDDLQRIEGIGEKAESTLNSMGITTYAQLAVCEPEQLQKDLTAAGLQLIPGAAVSWPAQAALAAAGRWNALKIIQQEVLKGGRSAIPDDLQKIRGIGPATAAKLDAMGITTFRQLAQVDPEQLETDLKAAGVNLQLGTALSWPEQAKLASENRWVELETMKQELAQLHQTMGGSEEDLVS